MYSRILPHFTEDTQVVAIAPCAWDDPLAPWTSLPPYPEREARDCGKGEQRQGSTLHQKCGPYCERVSGLVLAVVADLVDDVRWGIGLVNALSWV